MKKKISALTGLAIFFLLTGCGGGGDEASTGEGNNNPQSACGVERCVNLENAEEIPINGNERISNLLGGETIAVKFNATIGEEYKVHVVSNVSNTAYITDSSPLVPSQALLQDSNVFGGHSAYDFQAKNTGPHYVVVEVEKSTDKVEASIRVTSRKENLTPLAGTEPLKINDIRTEFSLIPGASKRWYFDAKQGKTYHIYGAKTNGAVRMRTSVVPSVDKYEYDERDDMNGKISFQAKENQKIFIAAADSGNGSDGNIRVYSYDETATPIGNEQLVTAGAVPLEFSLNPKQYKRFFFVTNAGKDHTVSVKRLAGNIGSWLSVLPTVDSYVYEKSKTSCTTCTITWRETAPKRWYLAVGNSSPTSAGKFTVQLSVN